MIKLIFLIIVLNQLCLYAYLINFDAYRSVDSSFTDSLINRSNSRYTTCLFSKPPRNTNSGERKTTAFKRNGDAIKRKKPTETYVKRRTSAIRKPNTTPLKENSEPKIIQTDKDNIDDSVSNMRQKNYASKSISGESIIDCRRFSLDSVKTFTFEGSYDDTMIAPVFGLPEIAFIGRSNVGKSSLLNMLSGLNKDLAVVSKTPGRTRLINMFKCKDKDGGICMFVDLPGKLLRQLKAPNIIFMERLGYGFAKLSKGEQSKVSDFLSKYLIDRGSLRLVVVLVDIRREVQEADREIIEYLEEEGVSFIVVATKCDKLPTNQVLGSLSQLNQAFNLPPGYPIPISSVTGYGRKDLWKLIRSAIIGELFVQDDSDGSDEDDEDDPLLDIVMDEP